MVGILKRSRAFNWRAVYILEMVVMQMDGKLMSRIEGKISRSIVLINYLYYPKLSKLITD